MAKLRLPDPKVTAARLAKVTGNAPEAPRPRQINIPGFVGPPDGMIIPPGKLVSKVEPADRFTSTERDQIKKYGWTPKSDVTPEEVGDVIELLEAEAGVNPALDPTLPPTEYEVKDYANGTPEQRKSFDDAVMAIREKNTKAQIAEEREANINPSVRAAIGTAQVTVEDDLDAKAKAAFIKTPAAEDAKPVTTNAKVEPTVSTSETGAAVPAPTICENCGHDRRIEAIAELPMADRENFLTSLMADKAYQKAYPLYNGKVTISFRSLTSNELDACFRAASYRIRLENSEGNQLDTLELTRRYRLCLQFQDMQVSQVDSALNATAPEGLCKELTPGATDFWATEEDGRLPPTTHERDKWLFTIMERIYAHLQDNVIKRESMMRIVFRQLNEFNRQVKWLEDHADDPAFLQPAEKQPS